MENYVYMCTMYDTVPQSINVNQATQRVLINPHFKANSKVFVNPNFVPSRTIHINPLLTTGSLKNIPDTNNQSNTVHINPLFSHKTASKCEDTKECPSAINRAIVLTKTKLIRSPYLKKKLVRNKDKIQKFGGTRACQSTNTRFKLDNRSQMLIGVAKKSTSRKLKINKLFRENNLSRIIKHTTLNQSMINICGIMYRKSKTSLRRTSNSSISQKKTFSNKKVNKDALKMKIVRLTSPKKNIHGINLDKKLKKCNIPCPLYKKYGICKAQISGKCFLKHDPDQIALCTRFLQGACIKSKCLLSHNVAPEKMPTCKYYLEGSCTRENCPYLHVKISSKADICRDFLEGFCKKASECNKRHQYSCPDYEKYGSCAKQRCPYPHGKMVRPYLVDSIFTKKCTTASKTTTVITKQNESVSAITKSERYYKEQSANEEQSKIENCVEDSLTNFVGLQFRPKLGLLPTYIGF